MAALRDGKRENGKQTSQITEKRMIFFGGFENENENRNPIKQFDERRNETRDPK